MEKTPRRARDPKADRRRWWGLGLGTRSGAPIARIRYARASFETLLIRVPAELGGFAGDHWFFLWPRQGYDMGPPETVFLRPNWKRVPGAWTWRPPYIRSFQPNLCPQKTGFDSENMAPVAETKKDGMIPRAFARQTMWGARSGVNIYDPGFRAPPARTRPVLRWSAPDFLQTAKRDYCENRWVQIRRKVFFFRSAGFLRPLP